MRILAFESSAKAASAALMEDGILLAQCYQNTGLTHSQTLLAMAEDLLRQCSLAPEQIQAAAVAAGPGSFTGVRIGMAAAKGFAWGNGIPCYGVSTLFAMALGLGIHQGYLCPVMDARRSQVYNALFSVENGECTRIREDRAISLEALAGDLKALDGSVFLVGDGSRLTFQALCREIPHLILPPEHRMHQQAAGVALAAQIQIARGDPGDPASLVPNYLRLSQAERERLEKLKAQA